MNGTEPHRIFLPFCTSRGKPLTIFTSPVDKPQKNQKIIKYLNAIKDLLVPTPGYMNSPSSLEAVIPHKREGIANSLQVKKLDRITLDSAEHFPNCFQREDWILPNTRGTKGTIELLTPILPLSPISSLGTFLPPRHPFP